MLGLTGIAERASSQAASRSWLGLAAPAALASLDEATGIHETVGTLHSRDFALLLELVEGRMVSSPGGFGSFEQAVGGTLQEAGEMLGALVVLDGLLCHLATRRTVVTGTVG